MARLIEDIAYQRRGANSVQMYFDDKDLKPFLDHLKTLPDKFKRSEMNKIVKRQTAPVLTALKANTKVAEINRTGKYGQRPGNLRDSMIISVRKFNQIGVWIGPKTDKFRYDKTKSKGDNKVANQGKIDGYYGFWIERGFTPNYGSKHVAGTHFMEKTMQTAGPAASAQVSEEVKKYIVNQIKKQLGK